MPMHCRGRLVQVGALLRLRVDTPAMRAEVLTACKDRTRFAKELVPRTFVFTADVPKNAMGARARRIQYIVGAGCV